MDIMQLHYFRTVFEYGSFKKAADILYLSRQGLAKIIQKMEDELGEPLFDVTSSGVVPTLFGQSFYTYSEEYIRFHQYFLQKVEKSKTEAANELIIGLEAGFSEGLGQDFLADFIIENRDIQISVFSYPKDKVAEAMNQKNIPLWIVSSNYNESMFHSLYSRKNKLFLLVSDDHPLTAKEKVSMSDLTPYRLIGLTHDIGQKGRINAEINRSHLKIPSFYLNASDRNLTMKLVQSGVAVSFNAGWHYQQYPGITALPLAELDISVSLHVLMRNDMAVNSVIQRFIHYLKRFLEKEKQ